MDARTVFPDRDRPFNSGKGLQSLTILIFLILVLTLPPAYSKVDEGSPAGEIVQRRQEPTMQSYHSGGGGDTRMAQVITFFPISDRVYGDGPLRLMAETSSGLDVDFKVNFGPAWLEEDMVNFTGPGVISIIAGQDGDDEFHPAPNVTRSFEVIGTWDNWLTTYFIESERSQPSISGDLADSDGDYLLNVVEYALGLDPREPSPLFAEGATMTITESGDYFVCIFSRNPDALDVSITIEESRDLTSWTPVATSVNGSVFQSAQQGYTISETNGGSVYRVELSSPISSATGYFQRVVVNR